MATGSLLGKADATLVAGSYREAMADVPADMSKVYAKREKTLEDFTTEVNKIWDKQFEDYKAFETRIIDKSDLALTNAIQGKSNTHNLEGVEREVFRIKETMKTFDKKGKDKGNVEWKKLEEELNKLVITTGANAEGFNSLNEAVVNNELHILGGDTKTLELYEAMVDDYNNNGNKTKSKYVDGDFVYTHPEDPTVKMTFTELQKKLERIDPRVPAATQTVLNGVKKHAATSKRPFTQRYANDINNQLVKLMKTPNDIVNVMHESFEGLDYSFYEALTGQDPVLQEQIYDALDALGGIDIDGIPGKENRETYSTPENAHLLQQAIIDSPHSKQIIADFLTDNIVADNYQIGVENRKVKDPKDTDKNNLFGKGKTIPGFASAGWQTGKTLTDRRSFALDLIPFNGVGGEYKYDEDNKNWLLNNDTENPMTMYDVLKDEGLLVPGDKPTELGAKTPKKAAALNMVGEEVENGLLTNVFMMDDETAVTQIKLALPTGFTVKSGTNRAGKFFGIDKVQVISDAGVDLGTFDVGYGDSKKALEESKRFNSNLQEYLTGGI